MKAPVIISPGVCLFKANLAHAISMVKARKKSAATRFMGTMRKDKKILSETCNELLIR